MKRLRTAGDLQIKYQPSLNTLLIRCDYKDYLITPTSKTTETVGFDVSQFSETNTEKLGAYYYEDRGYPNVGDMYTLGNKAISSILPSDDMRYLPVELNAEILAFLFGQSARLVRLYRLTKEREDG